MFDSDWNMYYRSIFKCWILIGPHYRSTFKCWILIGPHYISIFRNSQVINFTLHCNCYIDINGDTFESFIFAFFLKKKGRFFFFSSSTLAGTLSVAAAFLAASSHHRFFKKTSSEIGDFLSQTNFSIQCQSFCHCLTSDQARYIEIPHFSVPQESLAKYLRLVRFPPEHLTTYWRTSKCCVTYHARHALAAGLLLY